MKNILLTISLYFYAIIIYSANITDTVDNYLEIMPTEQIYYHYIHPEDYHKEAKDFKYRSRTRIIIKDDKITDTIRVYPQIKLQFDTINVSSGDKLNYIISDIFILFTRPIILENISYDYLIYKLENEFKKWELYVTFNGENSYFQANNKIFTFQVFFIPSKKDKSKI